MRCTSRFSPRKNEHSWALWRTARKIKTPAPRDTPHSLSGSECCFPADQRIRVQGIVFPREMLHRPGRQIRVSMTSPHSTVQLRLLRGRRSLIAPAARVCAPPFDTRIHHAVWRTRPPVKRLNSTFAVNDNCMSTESETLSKINIPLVLPCHVPKTEATYSQISSWLFVPAFAHLLLPYLFVPVKKIDFMTNARFMRSHSFRLVYATLAQCFTVVLEKNISDY